MRSPFAAARIERARAWLLARGPSTPLIVVAATAEAASDVVRAAAVESGAIFG